MSGRARSSGVIPQPFRPLGVHLRASRIPEVTLHLRRHPSVDPAITSRVGCVAVDCAASSARGRAERGDRRRRRRGPPRPDKIATELASSFKDDADAGLLGEAERPRRQQRGPADGRLERARHARRGQPARGRRPSRRRRCARCWTTRNVDYDTYWITNAILVEAATLELAGSCRRSQSVESIFPQVEVVQDEPLPGRAGAQGRRGRVGHRRHQRRRRVGRSTA